MIHLQIVCESNQAPADYLVAQANTGDTHIIFPDIAYVPFVFQNKTHYFKDFIIVVIVTLWYRIS